MENKKEKLLSEISIRMREINEKINEHREELKKLRDEQVYLIAKWETESRKI